MVYGLDSTAGWVGVAQAGKLGQVRNVVLLALPGGRKGEGGVGAVFRVLVWCLDLRNSWS